MKLKTLMCRPMTLAFLILVSSVFAKERVAILETVAEEVELGNSALSVLTDQFRNVALDKLPTSRYHIMTKDNIMMMLPPGTEISECVGECLVETGRNVNAHLVTQGKVTKVGTRLFFTASLYETKKSQLLGQVTVMATDIDGLVDGIIAKAPQLFDKVDQSNISTPVNLGGINNITTANMGDIDLKKRVLIQVQSNPAGALVTMDGKALLGCTKTPCTVEVTEGPHSFFAVMDKFQDANKELIINDTNKFVQLELVSNFGVLRIEPNFKPYPNTALEVDINQRKFSSGSIELNPGVYPVKITHPCYETVQFNAGIAMGKTEEFTQPLNDKQAGLNLSALRSKKPVAEPVFINDQKVGETPWSGRINLCSNIKVGQDKYDVDVDLKYQQVTQYTVDVDQLATARQKEILAKNQAMANSNNANKPSSSGSSGFKDLLSFVGWMGVIVGPVAWYLITEEIDSEDYEGDMEAAAAKKNRDDYYSARSDYNDQVKQSYWAMGITGVGALCLVTSWAF